MARRLARLLVSDAGHGAPGPSRREDVSSGPCGKFPPALTILDLQRQIGVDVYSDGEYRRGMSITGLPAAVEGFGPGAMLNIRNWRGRPLPYVPGQTGTRHAATAGQNPAAVIVGKLTPTRRISWGDQRRKLELLVDTARKVWPA